jgi:hypothetical protein
MTAPIASQEFMLAYDYLDWRVAQAPFENLGYWTGASDCDLADANPVRLRCAYVDSALLPTLGIQPIAGRNFTAQENRPGAARTALISYGLWRSRFAGEPAVVGRQLRLDGQSVTVAGVLPPRFEMPTLAPVDLLLPHVLDEAEQRSRKTAILVWTVARLKPRVTPQQAAAALQPLFENSLQSVSREFRKDVALSKFKNIPELGEWADGHILLQDHGNRVFFRNIKIRVTTAK